MLREYRYFVVIAFGVKHDEGSSGGLIAAVNRN